MTRFKGLNYRRPAYLLMLMNLFGFGLLFVKNNYNLNMLYVGAGLLGLFVLIYAIIVLGNMGDKFIVLMACMLITIGVLLLCRLNLDSPDCLGCHRWGGILCRLCDLLSHLILG